jgi:cation:H+ antiporter
LKKWLWITLAFAVTAPAILVTFSGVHLDKTSPIAGALIFGLAVIGSAFLLSWACEVAQMDIPAALAISVLALVAVLPEYAVDFSLTYQAATKPEYEQLAVANMIGANRMIVGLAWPLIIFLFWARFRKTAVVLEKTQRVEIGYLGLAGIYSLIIPLKGHIDMVDVVVLVGLFVLYTVRISRQAVEEPHLVGPAITIGSLARNNRRALVLGKSIGVDEVFMVQWFAPISSEAPEIVICILFTLRGMASAGLGALVASKVNQWTLLVGTLPLVFSLGSGRLRGLPFSNDPTGLPLNGDQVGAMFVTSGQTLLAVAIMINLVAHLWEAGLLFGLFVAQFFFPEKFLFLPIDAHYVFGVLYIVLALILFFRVSFHEHGLIVKTMFDFKKHPPLTPAEHGTNLELEGAGHSGAVNMSHKSADEKIKTRK